MNNPLTNVASGPDAAPEGIILVSTNRLRPRRSSFRSYFRKNYDMYLLLVPGLIYAVVFKLLPLLGISIAFVDYNMFAGSNPIQAILKSEFVGWHNFVRVFRKTEFLQALRNTFIISFMKIGCVFPLPIVFALIIHSVSAMRFKKVVQTIIYLPHFFSWVVVSGIFMSILSSTGIVNTVLQNWGLTKEPVLFFMDQKIFRWLLVFTDAWKEVGWSTIVYLAALTGVDQELYEAAVIDGARRFQQLIYITLPSILSTIILMLVLRVGSIMDAGFGQILVMYNPTVYKVADIIQTYVYRIGLGKMDFSLGTAVGLFNSVVALVLVLGTNLASRRLTGKSVW
ncbi:MAG: sugar ABC transporter permease [Clostridia bacterium]|nr:sugar ABC transporter permease [Clostridia bacterium]